MPAATCMMYIMLITILYCFVVWLDDSNYLLVLRPTSRPWWSGTDLAAWRPGAAAADIMFTASFTVNNVDVTVGVILESHQAA